MKPCLLKVKKLLYNYAIEIAINRLEGKTMAKLVKSVKCDFDRILKNNVNIILNSSISATLEALGRKLLMGKGILLQCHQ